MVDLILKWIAFAQINGLYINDDINTINLNECEKLKEVGKPPLTIFVKESDNQCLH